MSCTKNRTLRLCLIALMLALLVLPTPALAAKKSKPTPTPIPDSYDADRPELLEDDNLRGASCVLIDADTGRVLYDKAATKKRHPASTTKMMTLLLALEYGHLDETVTVPKEAGNMPSDSSVVPLKVGEKIQFLDLLYGLILHSGNDAANAVAVAVDGSIKSFVARMNERAEELGLEGTHFVNAHGLEKDGHYSTALDLAKLARAGMQHDMFREIVGTRTHTLPASNKREKKLKLKSPILLMDPESKYYYEGTLGVKTGTFNAAGYCFVGAAERNGVTLISVTLKSTAGGRWTDTKRLMQYGFSQYASYTLNELYQMSPLSVTIEGADGDGALALELADGGGALQLLKDDAASAMATAEVRYSKELKAPIGQGEVLGSLALSANGKRYSADLVASRDVREARSLLPFLGGTSGDDLSDPGPESEPQSAPEPTVTGSAPSRSPLAPLTAGGAALALALCIAARRSAARKRRRQRAQRRPAAQRPTTNRPQPQHIASNRPQPQRTARSMQPHTKPRTASHLEPPRRAAGR